MRTGWMADRLRQGRWAAGSGVLVAALVGSCSADGGGGTGTGVEVPATDVEVVVTSVTDGDSFRAESPAGEVEVRLLGLNSPELDECHGQAARDALVDLIEDRTIGLATEPEVDQFDRVLARAVVDQTYVNWQMVSDGHSVVMTEAGADREALLEAEEAARTGGMGMWAGDICGAVGPRAALEITTVNFDPPGADDEESVTIINSGSDSIDLMGFVLRDESSVNRFVFPGVSLVAGEELIVARGCGERRQGTIPWCTEQPIWNNEGDTVLLLDQAGRIVAMRRY
ncbi:MAG TPA: lamin tail domain-containing protein [Acidimicrobiia bacterium]|nr:lamin tail domain-containing protein [Acidimicrobiia bacterium]